MELNSESSIDYFLNEKHNFVFWCTNKNCADFFENNIDSVVELKFKDKNEAQYCKKCNSFLSNKGTEDSFRKQNGYKFAYSHIDIKKTIQRTQEKFKTHKYGKH